MNPIAAIILIAVGFKAATAFTRAYYTRVMVKDLGRVVARQAKRETERLGRIEEELKNKSLDELLEEIGYER
jgi:hypothetical protein